MASSWSGGRRSYPPSIWSFVRLICDGGSWRVVHTSVHTSETRVIEATWRNAVGKGVRMGARAMKQLASFNHGFGPGRELLDPAGTRSGSVPLIVIAAAVPWGICNLQHKAVELLMV